MASLFRRPEAEEDIEDTDDSATVDDGQLLPEVPEFAVVISESGERWLAHGGSDRRELEP